MARMLTGLILAGLGSLGAAAQEANSPKRSWKEIKWRKDVKTALADAAEQKKPILVFFYAGVMGQKGAPC